MTFQLDTSGAVFVAFEHQAGWDTDCPGDRAYTWPDLSPFEQGYVEALFASITFPAGTPYPEDGSEPLMICEGFARFSDLHPETLATIRKDCAEFERLYGPHTAEPHIYGRVFWEKRQAGDYDQEPFPPLTIDLDDEGKVRLREGAPA